MSLSFLTCILKVTACPLPAPGVLGTEGKMLHHVALDSVPRRSPGCFGATWLQETYNLQPSKSDS